MYINYCFARFFKDQLRVNYININLVNPKLMI